MSGFSRSGVASCAQGEWIEGIRSVAYFEPDEFLQFRWPDFWKASHRRSSRRMPFNMTKRQWRRVWWKTGAIW